MPAVKNQVSRWSLPCHSCTSEAACCGHPQSLLLGCRSPTSSPAALQLRGTTRRAALAGGWPGDAGLAFTGPECKIIISGFPFVSVFLYSHLSGHANDADCASPAAVRLKHEKTTCACYHHPARNVYKTIQLMLMLQGVSVGGGAFPRCCEIPVWHGEHTASSPSLLHGDVAVQRSWLSPALSPAVRATSRTCVWFSTLRSQPREVGEKTAKPYKHNYYYYY